MPPIPGDGSGQPSIESIVEAYGRFVPDRLLSLIGRDSITDVRLGDSAERTLTILFSDIRDFTTLSEKMSPQDNFSFINSYLQRMEPVIHGHNGVIDKYVGDAIMALFPSSPDDAVCGAIAMLSELESYNSDRMRAGEAPIRIGIGLNTGMVMLGMVGGRGHMEGTVIGDAVNLGARLETMTKTYGVPLLVSEHTYYGLHDAAAYDVRFVDRMRVKGKSQPESLYEVFDADNVEVRAAKRESARRFEEAVALYHFGRVDEASPAFAELLRVCDRDSVARLYLERCRAYESTGRHEGAPEMDLELAWDASYAIGDGVIDNQHQELFELVSAFVREIRACGDCSGVESRLSALGDATSDHFSSEEARMRDTAYPFLMVQQHEHARFMRYFETLMQDIGRDLEENRLYLMFRMQVLVVDWLANHTAGLDRHFGKHLKRM
jgi:hemerythrin